MEPEQHVTIAARGAGLVVAGVLDERTAPNMVSKLEEFLGRTVQVDMAGVTFMDSSGLSALLRIITNGTGIVIVDPSHTVRRLLEVTGLLEEFGLD